MHLCKNLKRFTFVYALFFLLTFTATVFCASESVQIKFEGISDKELTNAEAALALPPGIVKDGTIDELWLQRFERQIPDKVRNALSPFGYYSPTVEVTSEKNLDGIYYIHVRIDRGQPILVARVNVRVLGPGADEKELKKLVAAFPLHAGDVLRQDLYEGAKADFQNKAVALGFLDANFQTHEIRVSLIELSAQIDLVLQTGEQYRFGQITYSGAPQFPDSFLRRYVTFKSRGRFFRSHNLRRRSLTS